MADERQSIGQATMLHDRTIVLVLRAEGPTTQAVGDAQLVYPPTHPQYRQIAEHLGELRPGETKPVPPWPGAKQGSDPRLPRQSAP